MIACNNFSDKSALMPITSRPSSVMVRGAGSYLWDDSGKRYLDFIQGWAVNALGHCPPQIVDAVTQQANTLITPSPALHNVPQLNLADRLTKRFTQCSSAEPGRSADKTKWTGTGSFFQFRIRSKRGSNKTHQKMGPGASP